MNITIGLLVPRSDIFPLFPQHIVRGIKLAFENAGVAANFVIEDIGKAVIPDVVMAKANTMLMQDVDIVVAYAGKKVLEGLKALFSEAKKPLILLGMGPNIIREEEYGAVPYVASNSFDVWHSSYLLGQYAVRRFGSSGIASIGFFEGGYQFLPVFNEGVENAGGKIIATHFTKKLDEVDFTEALPAMLAQYPVDFLVEFYSGIDDERFFEVCIKGGHSLGLPIVTTSLGAEPFEGSGYPLVHGLSWQPFLEGAVNKKMIESYTQKHGNTPDAYAALAYETAMWVIEGIKGAGGAGFDIEKFCTALNNAEFESPRGWFTVDKGRNSNTTFPTIIVDGGTVGQVALTEDEIAAIETEFSNRIIAGWFNPYPCA